MRHPRRTHKKEPHDKCRLLVAADKKAKRKARRQKVLADRIDALVDAIKQDWLKYAQDV